ncbi:metallopeptidase family protein [Streptomyces sp. WMMB303]|uniref:metallopeptidase family protein n=1 Tax=Streptomyces sp. WMMB303 TaxID=3034154 RepID=UPI0023EB7432|nr:metallopeptidase family protein [Streptomyces sp. WMMB303]MDF4254420.1 metallopeptidase family protein [Streptomyces sp. WMMB303]
MTREEFEELVAEALDRIPPELTRLMDNVAVFVEDEPPADEPELLGLYEGTPLTERGEWYAGVLPDRITVYRGPTLRMVERESATDGGRDTEGTGGTGGGGHEAGNGPKDRENRESRDGREGVVEEVEITVVHEIAHHFGIDDDRLHALGYG